MTLDGHRRLTKRLYSLLHLAKQGVVLWGKGGLSQGELDPSHPDDQVVALFVHFSFV
jgi:hypothetical protein